MIVSLNQENFKKEAIENNGIVLVDFYADWCPPCQTLHPIFEDLAKKYEGKIKFARLNIGESGEVAQDYGVMSIPTLILFRDGKEIKRIYGLVNKDAINKELSIF